MMAEIELRHLKYFVAVAEEMNFTRAAERLGLAQPSLSAQIRQLEDRIGAPLLMRRPRLGLTAAGAAFLTSARQVLRHSEQAVDVARTVAAGSKAVVQVGLASSAALTIIPALICRFAASEEEVEVRITEMHSAEQIDALRNGVIDVGVSRETTTESRFVVRELFREPFILVLPTRSHLRRRGAVTLTRCAEEAFVLFPRSAAPMLYDQIYTLCRQAGFVPRVTAEAREWHTIVALTAAGVGISIAPASIAALNMSGVTMRPIRGAAVRAATFMCYSRDAQHPAVRRFADFIANGVGKRQP